MRLSASPWNNAEAALGKPHCERPWPADTHSSGTNPTASLHCVLPWHEWLWLLRPSCVHQHSPAGLLKHFAVQRLSAGATLRAGAAAQDYR